MSPKHSIMKTSSSSVPVSRATNDGWPSNLMPACAIEVSFCGAPTTASTSPASAALNGRADEGDRGAACSRARCCRSRAWLPPAALQSRTFSLPLENSASAIRSITCSSAAMPQALACREITPGSLTRTGWQAARTAGSSAALRLISGPMPAGSPVAMAIFAFISLPRHQRGVDHVGHAPWPPTERMARSTSFRPKRCVVTFSSGKRFEAICSSASSQAR